MTEHPIRLRNTASPGREAEPFVPRDWREGSGVAEADRRVRVYVCGPTVYDRAHIGNARPAVVFDVLVRLLRHVYGAGRVIHVSNLTDVDDKINARAADSRQPGESALEAIARITEQTVAWYHEDMAALGVARPDHEPRATRYVAEMVAMIERLIERGHAYAAEGHVLFAVASFPEYGALARRSLDEMRAGARVEVAPYKRDPMDFVLWKPSDPETPGWDSPWGRGRPGWHIECSAMAAALLGEQFDIHAGGIDLAFPHHENEVAQSRCAHSTPGMADVWLHNGYLMVGGEKMSKSLGNFTTVKDLRDRGVPGEVIRWVLLSTHYRAPLDWTGEKVEQATRVIDRWRRAKDVVADMAAQDENTRGVQYRPIELSLCKDLNTWRAISEIDKLAISILSTSHGELDPLTAIQFHNGLDLLGFGDLWGMNDWEVVQRMAVHEEHRETVHSMVRRRFALRSEAKEAKVRGDKDTMRKAFARADAIRSQLEEAGVHVEDVGEHEHPLIRFESHFDPSKLKMEEDDA